MKSIETDENYITIPYKQSYQKPNKLSYQMPPNSNSPPSTDNFINYYLNYMLKNKNLELNLEMYKEYNKN
jgi:hypothetical protein